MAKKRKFSFVISLLFIKLHIFRLIESRYIKDGRHLPFARLLEKKY